MESLRGQLLIAAPSLADPNFRRAVVLVCHHDDEGAMGLVLNRPSEAAVEEAVPALAELVEDDVVWVGGPVEPEAVMIVAEFDDADGAGTPAFGSVGFIGADQELEDVETRRARVFAGYAGWGAGQLEAELEETAWILEEAEADDVFAATDEDLWSAVLDRKGGAFALLATMPPDPSLN